MAGEVMIELRGMAKRFTLHDRTAELPVVADVDLVVRAGECVVLEGPSGAGKSSIIRAIYGNYLISAGHVRLRGATGMIDLAAASAQEIMALRRMTMGYVSQFLRALPRLSAIEVVATPLLEMGVPREAAFERAGACLERLRLPRNLWPLPPVTFSGGEQQRVNIARGLVHPYPILLLDEPTAALDQRNREIVADTIDEAVGRGAAVLGIFHDREVRDRVATRRVDIIRFRARRPTEHRRRAAGQGTST